MHDAEADSFHARHFQTADSDVSATVHMLLEHQFIVHLVNMVASQNDHIFRCIGFDDVDILEDGVGGAFIPLAFGNALTGWQYVETFIAFGTQEIPAALKVPDQRMRLILGRNADAANTAIERVGQRKVDDPGLAAEMHRRLCAPVGQLSQAAAAPPGQYIGHRITRYGLIFRLHPPLHPPAHKSPVCRPQFVKIPVPASAWRRAGL